MISMRRWPCPGHSGDHSPCQRTNRLVFGITAVFLSPTRSTIVSQIDFPNLHQFLDALTLMYRVTTRLAGQFHHTDDLREIRARQDAFAGAVPGGDTAAMILLNRDLHVAIAKAGQNPYYLQLFSHACWTRGGASCGRTATRRSSPVCRIRIYRNMRRSSRRSPPGMSIHATGWQRNMPTASCSRSKTCRRAICSRASRFENLVDKLNTKFILDPGTRGFARFQEDAA